MAAFGARAQADIAAEQLAVQRRIEQNTRPGQAYVPPQAMIDDMNAAAQALLQG